MTENDVIRKNRGLVHQLLQHVFGLDPDEMCYADAESLGLEALLRAVRRFDAGKGAKFSTFASLCIRRAVTTFLLQESRRKRLPVLTGATAEDVPAPERPDALADRELARLALRGVAMKYRLVLRLRYYEGLEPQEMGRALGISRQAADSRVRDAVRECRQSLRRRENL